MNPFTIPPAMGKIVGHPRLFNQGMAIIAGEGKLSIQTC